MGLLDVLTGRHKLSKPAAEDRLFALSTAYVTLQAGYGRLPALMASGYLVADAFELVAGDPFATRGDVSAGERLMIG